MATQLFLLSTVSDYATANNDANLAGTNVAWEPQALGTSRGSGVTAGSRTAVAGPTPGLEFQATAALVWYSPPIDADVTISGSITWNLWASETAMTLNGAINGRLEVIDGATGVITLIDQTARVAEVNLTTRAVNNFAETPAAGVACKRGDRLRVRIFIDDAGTMNSGGTFSFGYNGTTATADGDSYFTLTETLSFASAPSGTTIYPTNTAATGFTAPSLISSFSSNQNPLSEGGNWALLDTSYQPMQVTSTQARGSVAGPTNQSSYYTPTDFTNVEMYATLTVSGTCVLILYARVQDAGGTNAVDGYTARAATGENGLLGLLTNAVGGGTIKSNPVSTTWATGDKLGLAIHGSKISLYRWNGSLWQGLALATDTTYPSAGKIAIFSSVSAAGFDDLYAGDVAGTFHVNREAWTSRGAGVQSDVVNSETGWVVPLPMTDSAGGPYVDWYTRQLAAFTLGGAVTVNARALESSASANAAIGCEIAVVNSDGTDPVIWATGCRAAEIGTSEAALSFLVSGDDLSVSDTQRLRIRFFIDDLSVGAMATGHTATLFYAGTSGGASGDTFLTFTQTLTEYVPGVDSGVAYVGGGYYP